MPRHRQDMNGGLTMISPPYRPVPYPGIRRSSQLMYPLCPRVCTALTVASVQRIMCGDQSIPPHFIPSQILWALAGMNGG